MEIDLSKEVTLDDPVSSGDLPICEGSHGCCFETVCEDLMPQDFFSSEKTLDNPVSVDPVGVPKSPKKFFISVCCEDKQSKDGSVDLGMPSPEYPIGILQELSDLREYDKYLAELKISCHH